MRNTWNVTSRPAADWAPAGVNFASIVASSLTNGVAVGGVVSSVPSSFSNTRTCCVAVLITESPLRIVTRAS